MKKAPLQFTPNYTYRYLQEHIEDFYLPQEIWQHIRRGSFNCCSWIYKK